MLERALGWCAFRAEEVTLPRAARDPCGVGLKAGRGACQHHGGALACRGILGFMSTSMLPEQAAPWDGEP